MGQKAKKAGTTKNRNRTCDKPANRTNLDYMKSYIPKKKAGRALKRVLADYKDGGELIEKANELTEDDDERLIYRNCPPHLSRSAWDKKRMVCANLFPKSK